MIVETIACLQLLESEPLIIRGSVVRSSTPPLWVLVPNGSVSISHGRSLPSVCECECVWIDGREGNCTAFPIKVQFKWKCIYHLIFPDAQSKVSTDVVSPQFIVEELGGPGSAEPRPEPHPRSMGFIETLTVCVALSPNIKTSTPLMLVGLKRRNSLQPGRRLLQQHIHAQSFGKKKKKKRNILKAM